MLKTLSYVALAYGLSFTQCVMSFELPMKFAPREVKTKEMSLVLPFPPNWRISPSGEGSWGAYDPQRAGGDIRITVANMKLEEMAAEDVLFEKKDGVWYKKGRVGAVPVQSIAGSNWKGFYGVANCGIDVEENGFSPVAGECMQAIVTNGKWSAMIETDGKIDPGWVLENIVLKVRFGH